LAPSLQYVENSVDAGLYEAHNLTKRYAKVSVLRDVSLTMHPGRIHTIMGENGAGKSTAFKILAGLVKPSSGSLHLAGQSLSLASPAAAHHAGIYLVPQEPALMAELTVTETMFVGQLPTVWKFPRRIDWKGARARACQALETLSLDIDPDQLARHLSIAQQQQLECAKALLRGCRVILFDEPTSPLTTHEVERLFITMRRLRADGYTLGFISHRMDEVLDISDDISVLRDGALVDSVDRPQFERVRLLSKMVGREMRVIPRRQISHARQEPILQVTDLAHEPRFRNVSFTLNKGEILGFAGLVGAGRTEIAETIFGIRRRDAGTILLAGQDISETDSHDIIRKGLVYAPEDRAKHGAVLPMTITENVTSGLLERVKTWGGLISQPDEDRIGAETVARYRVRCAGTDQKLRQLSGGNQQKVVFGKWMGIGPDVAILDEPTRGVDVGAKDEIYELIDSLALEGMGILVISSELEELVRICDRILSIYEGEIVAELAGDDITPERVSASYLTSAAASGR
jgi:ABC-type sugar transport system ATPase subunit